MSNFMFWSGVVAWGAAALFGLSYAIDFAIDWLVSSLWTKREFMAFVWSRLKKQSPDDNLAYPRYTPAEAERLHEPDTH